MPSTRRSATRSVVTGVAVVIALVVVVGTLGGTLFDLSLPFTTEEKDHSPPLVLTEIRDLAQFRAAEAEFEVIVDRESDVKWVPAFIAGERVQYVAVGSVDAIVDFGRLSDDSLSVDSETNTAIVILPAPVIGDPVIDLDRSGVMNRDRGVLDRLGGVFSDNPTAEEGLIREAESKMVAAVAESDLMERARASTTATLEALLTGLGFDGIRVVFEQPTRT